MEEEDGVEGVVLGLSFSESESESDSVEDWLLVDWLERRGGLSSFPIESWDTREGLTVAAREVGWVGAGWVSFSGW